MSFDSDTAIGGSKDRFPSTQLSLLASAAPQLSREARERIIEVYWKPVYRFIRVKYRKDNEDAKDLTQGFFTSALQRDFFERFDSSKASFRTYLRMAVQRYVASEYSAGNRLKRGGGIQFCEAEEPAGDETPEVIFEREWQRQLFSLAIEDLRAQSFADGKQLPFRIFEEYDLAAAERPSYAELAQRHCIAETSVTNYLAWARRSLRSLLTSRLRGITSGERELSRELKRLWS